jgi:hypothetical protein
MSSKSVKLILIGNYMLRHGLFNSHTKAMMNKLFFIVIVCIIGLLSMKSYGQNLENYQWENRVLIVKTSNIKSEKYINQLVEFQNYNDQLKERKFIVYKINKDEFSAIDYRTNKISSGKISTKMKYNLLDEKENFEVILIGLDGNIKLQKNEIITKEILFALIDSMPMRKYELKN